ncbi:DUF397 domain-containing protein [Saccharopolyspora sp. 5N708]|uniref:DUF397 domain-containing protein n=1 Tax=Saccharopolyspora sp. 5N708 TaxID=3457424 RepID=UPI003FD1C3E2
MKQFTDWRKSSYSGVETNCVEVGSAVGGVGVRDTKDRDGGILAFGPESWAGFLASVKAGRFG